LRGAAESRKSTWRSESDGISRRLHVPNFKRNLTIMLALRLGAPEWESRNNVRSRGAHLQWHNENSKSNLPAWKSGWLRCWLEAVSLLWTSLRLNFEYFFQPTDNKMLYLASRAAERTGHFRCRAGPVTRVIPAGGLFLCFWSEIEYLKSAAIRAAVLKQSLLCYESPKSCMQIQDLC